MPAPLVDPALGAQRQPPLAHLPHLGDISSGSLVECFETLGGQPRARPAKARSHGIQPNAREATRASVPRTTTRGRWSPNRSPSASKGCLPRGWWHPECHDQPGEHRDGSGISATAGRKTCSSAELLRAHPASAVSGYIPTLEVRLRPQFPAAPGRLTWRTTIGLRIRTRKMLGWTGETRIGSGHSEDAHGPSIGECNAGENEIRNEFLSVQPYGWTPTSVPCRAGTRAALHHTSHPCPEAWRGGAVCNDHLRPARQRQDRAPAVGRAPRARRGHRSNQCLIEHDRYRGGGSPKTFGGTVVERHRRGGLGVRPSSSNR